jgi:putative endonuclease
MYFVYILKSRKDGTYYYGSTANLPTRIEQHNRGKVKYTKGHLPYQLYYYEKYKSRAEAIKREKFFKTVDGYRWLKENKIT